MEVFSDRPHFRKTHLWPTATSFQDSGPEHGGAIVAQDIRRGDAVIFARLDLAELLGIWRHAQGRVVSVRPNSGTVDVEFDGHPTLHEYLPTMFQRVN